MQVKFGTMFVCFDPQPITLNRRYARPVTLFRNADNKGHIIYNRAFNDKELYVRYIKEDKNLSPLQVDPCVKLARQVSSPAKNWWQQGQHNRFWLDNARRIAYTALKNPDDTDPQFLADIPRFMAYFLNPRHNVDVVSRPYKGIQ
jgi:hypothetical protein